MSIIGLPKDQPNPAYTIEDFKIFVPRLAEFADVTARPLFDAFYQIANQKILKLIWNSDWTFAMSYCIAHYIDLTNRDTQKSFSMFDVGEDSGPTGIISKNDKATMKYTHTMLDANEAKFWNATEYGRVLYTLLNSKAVITMMVIK